VIPFLLPQIECRCLVCLRQAAVSTACKNM